MIMIRGTRITLRPATKNDRRDIYLWLTASDVTASMMGSPTFPEVPIPTWDEFCGDYAPHFFEESRSHCGCSFIIEVDDEAVGHINYDGLDSDRAIAELDIWMRSQIYYCGGTFQSIVTKPVGWALPTTLS